MKSYSVKEEAKETSEEKKDTVEDDNKEEKTNPINESSTPAPIEPAVKIIVTSGEYFL